MRLFPSRQRFQEWVEYDDGPQETFLAEVGGSWVDDEVALGRVNAEYAPRDSERKPTQKFPGATVRQWVGSDEEFAAALKVAREMRSEARRLGKQPAPSESPEDAPVTLQEAATGTRFVSLEDMPSQGRRRF